MSRLPWLAVALLVLLPTALAAAEPAAPPLLDPDRGVLSFAKVLDRVLPSVVQITIRSTVDPVEKGATTVKPPGKEHTVASGSGVIIDAKNGYVLTNNHVVTDDGALPLAQIHLRVALRDGREFDARLVGRDEETDIAVIQIKADHLSAITVGDSASLQVGDVVLAIGYPLGLDQTVTFGVVSGLRRHLNDKRLEDFIQTDAAINHGNSGGPLIDSLGRLVGIDTALANPYGQGNIGLNFAVPTRIAMSVSVQLEHYGDVHRGRIGIVAADLTPAMADALKAPVTRGALIRELAPDLPAIKAGLKVGDIIVRAGESEVLSTADLRTIVGLTETGETISVSFFRDGHERQIMIKIPPEPVTTVAAAAPPPVALERADETSFFGATFRAAPVTAALRARDTEVVVAAVTTGTPADAQGLQVGDVVQSVNRHAVHDLAEFKAAIGGSADAVAMQVMRGTASRMAVFTRAKSG